MSHLPSRVECAAGVGVCAPGGPRTRAPRRSDESEKSRRYLTNFCSSSLREGPTNDPKSQSISTRAHGTRHTQHSNTQQHTHAPRGTRGCEPVPARQLTRAERPRPAKPHAQGNIACAAAVNRRTTRKPRSQSRHTHTHYQTTRRCPHITALMPTACISCVGAGSHSMRTWPSEW